MHHVHGVCTLLTRYKFAAPSGGRHYKLCQSILAWNKNIAERLGGLVVEFLATDPNDRVRFQVLPDFLRSSGSGTGFTQPREYK
jgi:hypothetical protein